MSRVETIQCKGRTVAPLLSTLRYAGHVLTQVLREKSIAIYARSRPNREPHELELVVIRVKPESRLPNGTVVPEREAYPSNSEWGQFGWSFPIRERELVLELARRMTLLAGPFGAWMRENLSFYKVQGKLSEMKC
jgi:hypothetical protein